MKRVGGMEVELHGFLFRLCAEASCNPGGNPLCPVVRRLGGPQFQYAVASQKLGRGFDCPRARDLKVPAH